MARKTDRQPLAPAMAPEVHFDDNAQHAGADATIHRSQPCWSVSPMSALPCHPGQTIDPGSSWVVDLKREVFFKQQDHDAAPRGDRTPLSENEQRNITENSQCDGHGQNSIHDRPSPKLSRRRLGSAASHDRINRSHVSPQTDKVWSHFSHPTSSARANAVSKSHVSISEASPRQVSESTLRGLG